MKKTRKKDGTNVAIARPFTVFRAPGTEQLGVRIGTSKPFIKADEVVISAAPLRIMVIGEPPRLAIMGEGVVRRHGKTIAVTA